ncbi:MAG: ABC transporter permease [Actinobacteria bacterium]|nr:ABC transporter permease [Actinomycetota bacterium]
MNSEILFITFLSLKISLTAVFIASIMSIFLASIISFKNFYGKKLIVNLIHTFMGLPPVVVGLVLYLILSRNGFLGGLDLLYTPTAMIIAQVILALPIITGISINVIERVEKAIKETIISLGATTLQGYIKIIKEARHGIMIAIVTGFGRTISEVGAIIIVGGNIKFHTRTLTTAIVSETSKGEFKFALTLGVILILISFFVNYALTVFSASEEK